MVRGLVLVVAIMLVFATDAVAGINGGTARGDVGVLVEIQEEREVMVKGVVLVMAVMLGFAADAVAGMNEFESCRCSSGLATKGDTKQEVLQKCGRPAQIQSSWTRDCREMWPYNFGRQEFMQGICFDGNKVKKVLSLDYGY